MTVMPWAAWSIAIARARPTMPAGKSAFPSRHPGGAASRPFVARRHLTKA